MNTNFNVVRMLILSTAHMPTEDAFEDPQALETIACDAVEYGWLVYVTDEPFFLKEMPNWIRPIMHRANDLGCRYIKFDRDAQIYPDFIEYEW